VVTVAGYKRPLSDVGADYGGLANFLDSTTQDDRGNAILDQILEQLQKQTRVMEETLGAVKDIGGQLSLIISRGNRRRSL